jgi:2-phosphosulfolactate phosphatase
MTRPAADAWFTPREIPPAVDVRSTPRHARPAVDVCFTPRRARPAVDVCFTPREIRPADVAVVVDVLRATSTIVQAVAAGYPRVLCCGSVETARGLRADGRVLAGERDCVRVPDFELGNSPAGVATNGHGGAELVLATTNGSPAIVAASSAARRVVIGCLLNLGAVLDAIRAEADVTIVCSGTDGRPALEDVYVAGRLVAALGGTPSDAARVAARVASAYQAPLEPLAESEDGARLRATGQEPDIAWCARESALGVVPEVCSTDDGVAVVGTPQPSTTLPKGSDPLDTRT